MNKVHSTPAPLHPVLRRLRRRERLRLAIVLATRATCLAGAAAAIVLIAALIRPSEILSTMGTLSGWAVAACAGVGLIMGLLWPVDNLSLARAMDRTAQSQDRLASALELADHPRQARVSILMQDALRSVASVPPKKAIPIGWGREARWLPIPVVAILGCLFLPLGPRAQAEDAPVSEVSDDEWSELADALRESLDAMPEPEDETERELRDELERLADLMEERPEKRDVLARIAELREQLDRQREGLGSPDVSMRQAARALQSSDALKNLAAQLQSGDYQSAVEELRKLADQLRDNALQWTAEDFESASSALEQMAQELSGHQALNSACRACASAASTMNREAMADAMRRFAETLEQNADDLKQCEGNARSRSALDELMKRLNQCKGSKACDKCGQCCGGKCSGFVQRSNKRGGLKAGWGTADNWQAGSVKPADETRMPALAEVADGAGAVDTFKTVSPDERAVSAQPERERFIELIKQAEADLDLELVPLAYRDYLKRYFMSIQPGDGTDAPAVDTNSGG